MINQHFRQMYQRGRIPLVLFWDKIRGVRKPRIVVLVVNNACNLRCAYCFGEYHKRSATADFTTDELKRLIDDLRRNGTLYLTVHGGETLLRKDIGEIVDYIKCRGMYVNLITNGTLLASKIDEIAAVDGLCISLDGREENNDRVRGKGSFKAAMAAMQLVKQRGIPLRVQATITRYTRNDMAYLAELAQKMQFHLEFSLLFQSTPGMSELILDDAEIREVLREIIDLKRKGYPIFTSDEALELAVRWPYTYTRTTLRQDELPPGFSPIPCMYGRHKFTIDADGRAFPCFAHNKTFNALNLHDVDVQTAFKNVVDNTTCVLCPYLSNNDWSYMTTLSPRFLWRQVRMQMGELLGRYGSRPK